MPRPRHLLDEEEKEILLSMGYSKNDITQICYVLPRIRLSSFDGKDEKEISPEQAKQLLGKRPFLSGLGRSSFHYTATRINPEGQQVRFDATKVF